MATRTIYHEHRGSLTGSFKECDNGQLVIMIGMLTCQDIKTEHLNVKGSTKIKVLGGIQSLNQRGVLTGQLVKVN
jgi:hypothetical protein